MLVLGVLISIIYDIVWFLMKHNEYAPPEDIKGTPTDGNVESTLKKFSLMVAYTSFFFRVSIFGSLSILVFRDDRSVER